ncbi:heat shock protein 9/12-domain-containing protein [Tuber borchii]|uniref:Heat shock protein 9/12-domain-containing protein n=1 Tax=Tuber borchii TaxID=42251 RepID=A0A2T7A1E2_TUBBO|nr:heat shock protein 9/12-domain-containing protein [Tuber borchii]
MSDAHRKDFSTKAKEEITPDSSKSTLDRTKESITNFADKIVGGAQSDHHKGNTQEVFDKTRREKDHQEGNSGSLLDKTKDTLSTDRH